MPFSHHIEIYSGTQDLEARFYYIHRTAEDNLSVKALEQFIKEDAYCHRDTMPSNFAKTIPDTTQSRKAVMLFKDSYLLDFINVEQIGEREAIDVDEREVEQQIVQNVKQFIMTFAATLLSLAINTIWKSMAWNTFLICCSSTANSMHWLSVELKTGEFKTSYLGQLMGYLSILEAKVKKPHENPPIGIVLCKKANREYVEFVIRDYAKPMGVATYKTTTDMPEELRKTLPDIEELKKLL